MHMHLYWNYPISWQNICYTHRTSKDSPGEGPTSTGGNKEGGEEVGEGASEAEAVAGGAAKTELSNFILSLLLDQWEEDPLQVEFYNFLFSSCWYIPDD